MHRYLFLIFFSILPLSISHSTGELERQTLVVSLDGFRWDYISRIGGFKKNPNIDQLIHNGAHAPDGIMSTFTTMTFPNHYTLVTGLYQENHGVISNDIYDPIEKKHANWTSGKDAWVFKNGEPIWTTMIKQKGDSIGCIMWIACQFGGFKQFMPYDKTVSWEKRVDQAIDWLSHETKLVLMYYHEPDQTGHIDGPSSKKMDEKLLEIDSMIGLLLKKLKDADLYGEVNLVILSDHGLMDVIQPGKAIITDQKLPTEMFELRSKEPALWLVEPLPDMYDKTIAYFKTYNHLTVFEKQNIPEKWHYKNNPRITPLMVLADPGYLLSGDPAGAHGYDNGVKEMRPTFMAIGPAFIQNSTVPPEMGTVDVYLLLCSILDLKPAPNNGTAAYFKNFLHHNYQPVTGMHILDFGGHSIPLFVSTAVTIFVVIIFVCHLCRKAAYRKRLQHGRSVNNDGFMYKPLPLDNVRPLLTTNVSGDPELEDSDMEDELFYQKHKMQG